MKSGPRAYGHVRREFNLRPFSAGSILTLRNRIEALASTTSLVRTPLKMQSTKLTLSMIAPGRLAIHYLRTGHITPRTGGASNIFEADVK